MDVFGKWIFEKFLVGFWFELNLKGALGSFFIDIRLFDPLFSLIDGY